MIGSAISLRLNTKHHLTLTDIKSPIYHSLPTVIADLRKPISPNLPLPAFDLIIHLAANARVNDLVSNPQLALDNILMIHNTLEYARVNQVPKFLFASSREVYGNTSFLVPEWYGSQRNSLNPYTVSKLSGEAYCNAYRESYGIDTRIMRFSNVYGRFDDSNRFIPKVIQKLSKNEHFELYGDKSMDFCFLDDTVSGIATIVDNWELMTETDREFNIGSGVGHTLDTVTNTVKKLLNSTSIITKGAKLPGEVDSFVADISRMELIFGWTPQVTQEEGLKLAIEYYLGK